LYGLGYLGMTAYIQSIFRDKIGQETKILAKLREDITTRERYLSAHQKLFVALLEKYSREKQALLDLASLSTNEINKSETLNSPSMVDFKKTLLNSIQQMGQTAVTVEWYKKVQAELIQHLDSDLKRGDFTNLTQLFAIYPHIWSLNFVIETSINEIVKDETTDQEARSILFTEYNTNIYPIYRKEFDKFGTGTFMHAGAAWSMLDPSAELLFPNLSSYIVKFQEWREQRQSTMSTGKSRE
jgi:hypothetical protein